MAAIVAVRHPQVTAINCMKFYALEYDDQFMLVSGGVVHQKLSDYTALILGTGEVVDVNPDDRVWPVDD